MAKKARQIDWIETSRKYRAYVSIDGRFHIDPSVWGLDGVAYTVTAAYTLTDMEANHSEKFLTITEAKKRAEAWLRHFPGRRRAGR